MRLPTEYLIAFGVLTPCLEIPVDGLVVPKKNNSWRSFPARAVCSPLLHLFVLHSTDCMKNELTID